MQLIFQGLFLSAQDVGPDRQDRAFGDPIGLHISDTEGTGKASGLKSVELEAADPTRRRQVSMSDPSPCLRMM